MVLRVTLVIQGEIVYGEEVSGDRWRANAAAHELFNWIEPRVLAFGLKPEVYVGFQWDVDLGTPLNRIGRDPDGALVWHRVNAEWN